MNTETTKIEELDTQEGKVGTMLHDVRAKKKISIDEITQKLHIKAIYIKAIEESDYDNIPKPPYGIGFVRSYASYLGLNSTRIVEMFKEETNQKQAQSVINSSSQEKPSSSEEEIYTLNSKYILISLVMFVLGYVLWSFFNDKYIEESETTATQTTTSNENYPLQIETFATESEEEIQTPAEVEQISTSGSSVVDDKEIPTTDKISEKTETTENKTAKTEVSTNKTPTVNEKINTENKGRVLLKVKKETWIEVKDDNKLWINKVLPAGSEYAIPDNGKGKTVSFGNTDGVDVVIDGKIVTIFSQNKKTNIQLDAFLGNH